MPSTPPPPAPSPDDLLVVRVQLTVPDNARGRAQVNATITVQRPRAVRPSPRRRLATLAEHLPALAASAIVGVLVEHLAALLTTLL